MSHNAPSALLSCPACGCQFDPGKVYSTEQIALNLGVARKTVLNWMWDGRLEFRLRPLGHKFTRAVDAGQLVRFLNTYWPVPDPESLANVQRQWRKSQAAGRKGAAARRRRVSP